MRGRFFWRMAALMGAFAVFLILGLALAVSLAAVALRLVHLPSGVSVATTGGVLLALALAGAVLARVALRRIASPAADLMEATGQLAEGDYQVRVAERGPPELRRLARAFNEMAARLGAHEEQRRHLLADVAHELRTPLAVLQGNIEGMLDGIYPRDDTRLSAVLEETRILSTLVEDLRTLALAETRTLELHRETLEPAALVQDAVAVFRAKAEERRVAITADCAHELPAIAVDPLRIRQVLSNLLANALEHTPAGGEIRIRCSSGEEPGTVAISVADTGSGIAPEDLPRIFERFYKSRDSRGSGLGLAIAQQLVALHGGRIGAESTVGKGTTVRFSLPVAEPGLPA